MKRLKYRHIEESIRQLEPLRGLERPKGGWIRIIRDALGMTMKQLASRVGVSQSMIPQYERAEVDDAITLGTLRRVADALGCDLAYALVPRRPIDAVIEDQARRTARRRLMKVQESMAIEDQSVPPEELEQQITDYTRDLVTRGDRSIWED